MVFEHGHTFWRALLLGDHGWVCDIVGHGAAAAILGTAIAGTAIAGTALATPPEITPVKFLTTLKRML